MANAASEWATADGETNDREKISGATTNPFFSHCAGRSRRMAFTDASLSADYADERRCEDGRAECRVMTSPSMLAPPAANFAKLWSAVATEPPLWEGGGR